MCASIFRQYTYIISSAVAIASAYISAFKTQEIIYVRKTWRRLQYVYYRLRKAKVVKS